MSENNYLPEHPQPLRPDEKLYFLHIYKTAGTTLSKLLESQFQPGEICPAHQLDSLAQLPSDVVRRYRLYWGHLGFKLADFVPDATTYLTMLRDPVDHVISIFEAVRRSPEHPHHDRVKRGDMTLADFLRDERASLNVRDVQVFTLTFWHLVWDSRRTTRLAHNVLTPSDYQAIRQDVADRFQYTPGPDLVASAIQSLERFAFVGLVDRMADSVGLLCRRFGWDSVAALPRLNAAPQRPEKDALPRETLELIREHTRLDSQVYAYAQRMLERRLRDEEASEGLQPARHLAA